MSKLLLLITICAATFFHSCESTPRNKSLEEIHFSIPDIKVQASDSLLAFQAGKMQYDGHLFSGTVERVYPDGQRKETQYLAGRTEGKETAYYADGSLRSERFFLDGRKVMEHRGWWPNGQQKFQYQYANGLYHGNYLEWYEDGTKKSEKTFVDGKKVGVHRLWWENGQIQYQHHFVDGRYQGKYDEWYPTGLQCLEFNFDNGEQLGNQKGWRENGQLYINYVVKGGRKYGLVNARLCYSLLYGEENFDAN